MLPFELTSENVVIATANQESAVPDAPPDLVQLFTDGACSGNPGPGGWGFMLKHPATGSIRCDSGAEPRTTNNRMELMGAIRGLESLTRHCTVELVTDSQYLAKGITEWMPNWKRNGWKRKERGQLKPVSNEDLWRRIDELVGVHDVRVEHVFGHRGHPENETVDRLAVNAIKALSAAGRLD
ncbi:ribonuclease HI [Tautonia sociabilis]|uniref:Ribonuclease H n=1 Tax=Tautonia sociabilis TaxID=2080755 RepID=A0A432MQ66_9BACT|nr:ribonuclease HI [Tautonia sociabilis]RUL89287.1 ribonuclease HI [Tautonia sociabilis]